MSDRTEYMREYKRKQRANAKEAGLCGECCTGKPRKGLDTCDDCLKARQERRN